jgi:hypothetical protein
MVSPTLTLEPSLPGGSGSPGASTDPGITTATDPTPTSSAGSAGGGSIGGGPTGGPNPEPAAGGATGDGPLVVGPDRPPTVSGLADVDVIGVDGLVTWAIPSLALGVPGLLLVLAVVAQTLGATAWLPVVRRWLGGFGFGRRRRDGQGASG